MSEEDRLKKLAGISPYALSIVLEAKVRTIAYIMKKYSPNTTFDEAKETLLRWFDDEWRRS